MTCRAFADFIDGYLAGMLSSDVLVQFDQHMAACPNCVRYLAHYRETIALGQAAFRDPEEAIPAEVPEDLVAAILAARPSR